MSTPTSITHASPAGEQLQPRFLYDAWYVAGFSRELAEGLLLERTILEHPVLLYRNTDSTATAIGNRCPHRFAPLSRGKLVNGVVHCGYHGLGFDRTGRCVRNPHGPKGALAVPSYAVVERGGLIWIWMGRPERADVSRIPEFSCLDNSRFFVGHGYLLGEANYELMTDNILDLSHIEFMHPGLGTEAVSQAKVEVIQQGEQLLTIRRMFSEVLPAGLAGVYRTGECHVNRTLTVEWFAPANMLLTVSIIPVEGDDTRERGSQTLHLFTPETTHSTHYFYVASMSRETATQDLADVFLAAITRAFSREDKPMIDAQQAMIGTADITALRPALLSIDKGPVFARRRLEQLIREQDRSS